MKIYTQIPASLPPTGLTLGTFDGVHLGHQVLLRALKKMAPFVTVVTFSNHPLEVLKKEAPLPICGFNERIGLLKEIGIDALIILPFTSEFASLSYSDFLSPFPITHLYLGEGAAFGKNREGTRENITAYAARRGFEVLYLPKVILDGEVVSSRRIRTAISSGDLELVSRLLGRPYHQKKEWIHA